MGPGRAFGEKALLESDPEKAKRGATIIANTFCEFIIIYREDFKGILKEFNKADIIKYQRLLKNLPNFDIVNSKDIKDDLMYAIRET